MYLRIAPELYPQAPGHRRIWSGCYEINRNFRNEGVSTQHNPEFTMLELYRAYADYEDLMEMVEALLRGMCESLLGEPKLSYQGKEYDCSKPFARMTVEDAIAKYNPDIDKKKIRDLDYLKGVAKKLDIKIEKSYGSGKLQIEIFEKTCEDETTRTDLHYFVPNRNFTAVT